ncbi:MAG: FAD-binding protein [Chloroflexi bacterium]|nr:FAD-binding protein [Chloroflexota bacterium]
MPRADVGVVGAGLAGLTAAIGLADAGARVHVLAAGHAATHWAPGTLDVGVARGAVTAGDAVERLAVRPGHPYGSLASGLAESLSEVRCILAAEGLDIAGELTDPLRPMPTSIGATRLAAIVPDGMSGALAPWGPDETLVVCSPAGFRDLWAEAVAASLRRSSSWRGYPGPARVEALTIELPGMAGRRNVNGLELATAFDDPAWRDQALDAIARALDARVRGPGRVALPAILGLQDHPAVLAAARARLPLVPFEVPLVPPSVPGMRMYRALREALRRRGGRIQVGEAVRGSIGPDRRVDELVAPAAARAFVLSVGAVVLATGGIVGGGIVAEADGTLVETVLGLPVEGPPIDAALLGDPFEPSGHPLEVAGVRTDAELRPIAPGRPDPIADNVRIAGSLLAGQRYLREHCGDGIAIASGRSVARSLAGSRAPVATTTDAAAGTVR